MYRTLNIVLILLSFHTAYIRVTEGMNGLFRVYNDVVLHMDIQDKLHKYKMKITQIKCDQQYPEQGKVEMREGWVTILHMQANLSFR